MKLLSFLLVAVLLLPLSSQAAPKILHVKLKQETKLTVHIPRNFGTKFRFPFILDQDDAFIPYSSFVTNPAFLIQRKDGYNFFIVQLHPEAKPGVYRGNLFANVADRHITIELVSDGSMKKHYTDIAFSLPDDVHEELVQEGVKRRTKALEEEFRLKSVNIDKAAVDRALAMVGVLGLHDPASRNIKEESQAELSTGEEVTVFVDRRLTYGPYSIFVFDIENSSHSIVLKPKDVKLFAVGKGNTRRRINGAYELPPIINPREEGRGVFTVKHINLNSEEKLALVFHSDQVQIETIW